MRAFFVHVGPAAIKVGRYWIGYASGNRPAPKRRRTAKRALLDASLILFLMIASVSAQRLTSEQTFKILDQIEQARATERQELKASREATVRIIEEKGRLSGLLESAQGEIAKVDKERGDWKKVADQVPDLKVKVAKQGAAILWRNVIIGGLVLTFGVCVWLRIKGVL